MSTTFTKLLTDCSVAMGDNSGTIWSRVNTIWPWAVEAMLAFPILRPRRQDATTASATNSLALAGDFREIISVEYPVAQTPPVYLSRKNRLDPDFYSASGSYDVDHDYASGKGWLLYSSEKLPALTHVYIQYLANHDSAMADDSSTLITVPDEYENILVAYVLAKGYRERLGKYMTDPTAHTSIILQMTQMVLKAEENYGLLVQRAQQKLADSRITPNVPSDRFDRVY